MKQVDIYTDGACSGNPGPGGWAAILLYGDHRRELSGGAQSTTNNRMEITAAISGINALREPCTVRVHSDSAYLVNAFRLGWLRRWQANGWLTAAKQPVENRDLWESLLDLTRRHQVTWVKVKGHGSDDLNNRCDELARAAVTGVRQAAAGAPTSDQDAESGPRDCGGAR